MKISEKQLEQIRNSVDIVDYIKNYVSLRKRGKNYIGLCPFHQEKTPSFNVSQEKNFYHCFGCGETGDVITFAKKYKNLSFLEAVKDVADFANIKIEEDNSLNFSKNREQEELYEINNFVKDYFSKNLFEKNQSEFVRDYLKKRNVKPQTQRIFNLGYAFPNYDAVVKLLNENKYDLKKAQKLGLIDVNDKNEYYDKFRGRLIFPIHTPNGRIAGFGGRILQNDSKLAKYINSQESDIYSKRKILYGFFHSKEEIRRLDKAILVEGYLDVISLFQNGIKNVVAASGTALTEDQVQFLSRYTKNIVVVFDGDLAGERAAFRSIEVLLKYEFNIRLLTLPDNEDPDSYIKTHSTNDFLELINSAKDFLSFQAHKFEEKGLLDDPIERTNSIRKLVFSISLIKDELMRANYIKNLSKNFKIKESILEEELDSILKKAKNEQQVKDNFQRQKEVEAKPATQNQQFLALEKEIVKLLFSGDEEIIGEVFDNIPIESIKNSTLNKICSVVHTAYLEDIISSASILDRLTEEEKNIVSEIIMSDKSLSIKWGEVENDSTKNGLKKLLKDTIYQHHLITIEEQLKMINKEISTNPPIEKIKDLMETSQELLLEKRKLTEAYNHY